MNIEHSFIQATEDVIPHQDEDNLEDSTLETRFYSLVDGAPSLQVKEEEKAPFAHYKENTKTEWKNVPHDEVYAYLKKRLFFNSNLEVRKPVKLFSLQKQKWEEPIRVPLDLVVGVAGFKDWTGRGVSGSKSWHSEFGGGSMDSMSVIQHYAGLSTDLPPVGSMQMYIQPNGKIFFDNGSGDSHRLAAAVLRGEESAKTYRVDVYQVDKNYL